MQEAPHAQQAEFDATATTEGTFHRSSRSCFAQLKESFTVRRPLSFLQINRGSPQKRRRAQTLSATQTQAGYPVSSAHTHF